MGGTKEEAKQGAVVEVIRKPDPRLGFKGELDLSAVLIDQPGILLLSLVLGGNLADKSWRHCTPSTIPLLISCL